MSFLKHAGDWKELRTLDQPNFEVDFHDGRREENQTFYDRLNSFYDRIAVFAEMFVGK